LQQKTYRNRPRLVPPWLNGQPQRTRRDWEIFFHFAYTARNGRLVENRDTGNFGNGFFEQLQPFSA
jgi:hypothetical protein